MLSVVEVVLIVLFVWLLLVAVQFVHEVGHGRVAVRYSERVAVRAAGPPHFVVPRRLKRWLGLTSADVRLGWKPWGRGWCSHAGIIGNQRLDEHYRAGYRATGLFAVGSVAFGVVLTVLDARIGELGLMFYGCAVPLVVIPVAHTLDNAFRVVTNDDRPQAHGSDAWHLRQIAKAAAQGEDYVPPRLPDSEDLRRDPTLRVRP
jgi:hypothetical protein